MPIPKKTPLETRDEYVSRCISELSDEYDRDQAAAICYAQLSANTDFYYKKKKKK